MSPARAMAGQVAIHVFAMALHIFIHDGYARALLNDWAARPQR